MALIQDLAGVIILTQDLVGETTGIPGSIGVSAEVFTPVGIIHGIHLLLDLDGADHLVTTDGVTHFGVITMVITTRGITIIGDGEIPGMVATLSSSIIGTTISINLTEIYITDLDLVLTETHPMEMGIYNPIQVTLPVQI
jgi:hypothetical protein